MCVVIDYFGRWPNAARRSSTAAVVQALLYVAFFGDVHGGACARRWIPIFGVNLQPSEFGRIALALVLAEMYFGDSRRRRLGRCLLSC